MSQQPPLGPPGSPYEPPTGPPSMPPSGPGWGEVPTAQPLPSQPPMYPPYSYNNAYNYNRRRSGWKWAAWGCGGCAVLIAILAVVGVIFGANVYSNRPLAHFPTPPGSHETNVAFNNGNGGSGQLSDDETWTTTESPSEVISFYSANLTGSWVVDSGAGTTEITFHRAGKSQESGSMTIESDGGGGTKIVVIYQYQVF